MLFSAFIVTLGLALTAAPGLAESLPEKPVILLNGQPVTEAVLNLSLSSQLQLSADRAVTWSSSKPYRADIDAAGILTAKTTGEVVVTAKAANGQKAACTVKISRMVTGLSVTGPDVVAAGRSARLKASVYPGNAARKKVSWTSSDPSVATVNGSGVVKARNVSGISSVVITATATDGSGASASRQITVRPAVSSVAIQKDGQTVREIYLDLTAAPTAQLAVQIAPAAAGQQVNWKSSSSKTVSVGPDGSIRALKTGSATITATAADGSGKKASVKVRVVRMASSVRISGENSVMAGKSLKLKASVLPSGASVKKVSWESSDPSVAKVDKNGKVTAQKVSGVKSATITARATDGSGVYAQHVVTVTPAVQTLRIARDGEPVSGTVVLDLSAASALRLNALIEPVDASKNVRWKVSSSSKARIDASGLLTGLKPGKVTVTATAADGSGRKASVQVSIIRAVKGITLNGGTELGGGQKGKLKAAVTPSNASNKAVVWASSDPSVVAVDKYGSLKAGNVTQKQQAVITATARDGSGVVGSAIVTVTPRVSKLALYADGKPVSSVLGLDLRGKHTLQLSAQAEPAAALQSVKWVSSSTKRATVDANGLVTAKSKGKVTISAIAKDGSGVKASCTVEIGVMVRGIAISGAHQAAAGKSVSLSAQVSPSDAGNKKVTWSSSNEAVAKVSSSGVVTASAVSAPTQVTISATAQDGSGTVAAHVLTIYPVAGSITISRRDAGMAAALILNQGGAKARLSASVSPAAASQAVSWKSSDESVAHVSADGTVTSGKAGTAMLTVTAKDGSGVKATLWVGVGDLNAVPYYFEVDRANQVVRVYERGADNTYTHLIKRMICSTGRNSAHPANRLYAMHGGRMVWMDGVAIYATRVNGPFLFHSVTYKAKRMDGLDATQYAKLGSPASAGCFRLLAGDAKWIYDNVPKGCFCNVMVGTRDAREYGAVSKPALKSGKWDPTNPDPKNPDFDPTYTSDVS